LLAMKPPRIAMLLPLQELDQLFPLGLEGCAPAYS
jgi:hypothetical protein